MSTNSQIAFDASFGATAVGLKLDNQPFNGFGLKLCRLKIRVKHKC